MWRNDEYMDILRTLEFAIVSVYRECSSLSDYDVARVLEVLMDAYSGEKIGRPPRNVRLSELERPLVERVRAVCEWRLGRAEPPADVPLAPDPPKPGAITPDEIILCLKRILTSAKWWTKVQGTRGYLNHVVGFFR